MFSRLMSMHGRDRKEKGETFVPWLYRYAQGPWRVNLSRLRREHPEMLDVAPPEDVERRLRRVEGQLETLDDSQRKLVRVVREIRAILGQLGPLNATGS